MLQIDHVILVVTDLAAAAATLKERLGLASVPGGRHPGRGTANRIVPLGGSYLEVMAVADPVEAAASPFGRWALAVARDDLAPAALCLRTDDLTPVAGLLGEEPDPGRRVRPDGGVVAWRTVGLAGMHGPHRLPFVIEWSIDPSDHPGRMAASHRLADPSLGSVEIGPVPSPMDSLLAGVPGLAIAGGEPGVHHVTLDSADGHHRLPG